VPSEGQQISFTLFHQTRLQGHSSGNWMQMEMLGSNHDVNLRQGNTHMPLVAGFIFLHPLS
jgi:hypothetical protein